MVERGRGMESESGEAGTGNERKMHEGVAGISYAHGTGNQERRYGYCNWGWEQKPGIGSGSPANIWPVHFTDAPFSITGDGCLPQTIGKTYLISPVSQKYRAASGFCTFIPATFRYFGRYVRIKCCFSNCCSNRGPSFNRQVYKIHLFRFTVTPCLSERPLLPLQQLKITINPKNNHTITRKSIHPAGSSSDSCSGTLRRTKHE